MKALLAALVAAPLLATAAVAAERPLNEGQFIQAHRCVAYASLPALSENVVDLTTVKARIAESRTQRTAQNMMMVQDLAREAANRGEKAKSAADIEDLYARRDRYCSAFVDATQLAARSGSTSQQ